MSELVVCSARSCRDAAVWGITWRNPRIHDETRRKVWTACPAHLDSLRDFLSARAFPLDVVRLDELGPHVLEVR